MKISSLWELSGAVTVSRLNDISGCGWGLVYARTGSEASKIDTLRNGAGKDKAVGKQWTKVTDN